MIIIQNIWRYIHFELYPAHHITMGEGGAALTKQYQNLN